VIGFYVHASNIVLLLARKRKKERNGREKEPPLGIVSEVWRCTHEIERARYGHDLY